MFTRLIINSDVGKAEVVCDIDCPWTVKIFFLYFFQDEKSILQSTNSQGHYGKEIDSVRNLTWTSTVLIKEIRFHYYKRISIISIQSIDVISAISEEWTRRIAN